MNKDKEKKSNSNKKNIARTVEALLFPVVTGLGYELWDVVYEKEGVDYYLRIIIDSEEGITTDDCEKVHRAIDPIIDEADPIEDSYMLEVSSPGIERELRTAAHIQAYTGTECEVEVRFFAPINKVKSVRGIILSYNTDEDTVTVLTSGSELTFKRRDAAKITTVYDFGDE